MESAMAWRLLDTLTHDEKGKPWNVDEPGVRKKLVERLKREAAATRW